MNFHPWLTYRDEVSPIQEDVCSHEDRVCEKARSHLFCSLHWSRRVHSGVLRGSAVCAAKIAMLLWIMTPSASQRHVMIQLQLDPKCAQVLMMQMRMPASMPLLQRRAQGAQPRAMCLFLKKTSLPSQQHGSD